jgi:hypothetical protein
MFWIGNCLSDPDIAVLAPDPELDFDLSSRYRYWYVPKSYEKISKNVYDKKYVKYLVGIRKYLKVKYNTIRIKISL